MTNQVLNMTFIADDRRSSATKERLKRAPSHVTRCTYVFRRRFNFVASLLATLCKQKRAYAQAYRTVVMTLERC